MPAFAIIITQFAYLRTKRLLTGADQSAQIVTLG